MVQFVDQHRDAYGVESICKVLPIAPSTYVRHRAERIDPTRRSTRARRDDELRVEIRRVWHEPFQVYGPRNVWKQLRREGMLLDRNGARAGASIRPGRLLVLRSRRSWDCGTLGP